MGEPGERGWGKSPSVTIIVATRPPATRSGIGEEPPGVRVGSEEGLESIYILIVHATHKYTLFVKLKTAGVAQQINELSTI